MTEENILSMPNSFHKWMLKKYGVKNIENNSSSDSLEHQSLVSQEYLLYCESVETYEKLSSIVMFPEWVVINME